VKELAVEVVDGPRQVGVDHAGQVVEDGDGRGVGALVRPESDPHLGPDARRVAAQGRDRLVGRARRHFGQPQLVAQQGLDPGQRPRVAEHAGDLDAGR
jgi:hypothetical protein